MGPSTPYRVIIAGAGVAAFEAALALRKLTEERAAVVLVAPESEFIYRPLAVAEPFRADEVRRFPLSTLAEAAGAQLKCASVSAVDAERRLVATADGARLSYDALLLALGAQPREAIPGALTFRGPQDDAALAALLHEATTGKIGKLVFALPGGVTWPLPLYELALLTGIHLADAGAGGVELEIVTPEAAPLELFGTAASEAIRDLLEIRGIALRLQRTPVAVEDGTLRLVPEESIEAGRVVALPRLEGPRLAGIPHDGEGFIRTDLHGRVEGVDDVWAAGDLTAFPVKQGGLAAQQADAAAESIAARAGAPVDPEPFKPILRGLLLTGLAPRFLRTEFAVVSTADTEPLWWPPAKIVGRYLAPFLASHLGLSAAPPRVEGGKAVEIEVELDPQRPGSWSDL